MANYDDNNNEHNNKYIKNNNKEEDKKDNDINETKEEIKNTKKENTFPSNILPNIKFNFAEQNNQQKEINKFKKIQKRIQIWKKFVKVSKCLIQMVQD